MSNRRRLERELLEYYLVYLILAYRRLILIVGLLLLAFGITTIFVNRIVGFAALLPAIFLLLLSNSYNAVVYTAQLVAWIATPWRQEGLSADEKLMEATHYGMRRLRERFKGIGHGWPFTLTAILVKVEAS